MEGGWLMNARALAKNLQVRKLVAAAMREDLGAGDATSRALVPADARSRAVILSRGDYVVAGATVAALAFQYADRGIRVRIRLPDGMPAKRDAVVMELDGPARGILAAERTALNFMQRLSGTATLTARFVAAVKPYGTMILDTRKTTPCLRLLEKYAVTCGGGTNHRMGLHDRILIKDNHRRLWSAQNAGRLDLAVRQARKRYPKLCIEIEVESEAELENVLPARPDWIMLDNMSPAQMKRCVAICRGRALLEASGGITLANAARVARTGVDAISLGCLTHSAPAADLSLEFL
jgi:nicotinate-nucleotide pyrophosphorylase (carboxylating)